jgi:hypothetical protein
MASMRHLFAPVLAFAVVAIAACGGGGDKPPPSTGGDQKQIDTATGKDMSKVDEQAWKEAGLTIPPDADAGSGGASGSATPPPKPVDTGPADECTPAGVDFEKRNRDKLKACYAEGKKKDPNLEGTVRLSVSIDMKGAVKSIKITEKTLPDTVANCMLKVLKAAPFPEAKKCPDKNITIPMTFPTPK